MPPRFLAPCHVPQVHDLARHLGADARAIARHLGVAERTVYHWQRHGNAPRTACLALWWETHEGRGTIAGHALEGERLWRGLAVTREEELGRLRAAMAKLQELEYGSANAPHMRYAR